MNSIIGQTLWKQAAPAAGFVLAIILCWLTGCSRDAAETAGDTEQRSRRPAASIPPGADSQAVRTPDVAGNADAPQVEDAPASDAVDPRPLDEAEVTPGHDALVEALEANGGDLKLALKAISSRIEFSARDEVILLNLSGAHVTDAALEKIGTLESLLVLDIWDAPITDAGLSRVAGMTQLRALGLRGTRVTDDGLEHLEEMTSLKELNLELTAVTDAGLQRLGHLRSLHKLGLDDTAVTGEGINDLQVALPLCEIAW